MGHPPRGGCPIQSYCVSPGRGAGSWAAANQAPEALAPRMSLLQRVQQPKAGVVEVLLREAAVLQHAGAQGGAGLRRGGEGPHALGDLLLAPAARSRRRPSSRSRGKPPLEAVTPNSVTKMGRPCGSAPPSCPDTPGRGWRRRSGGCTGCYRRPGGPPPRNTGPWTSPGCPR